MTSPQLLGDRVGTQTHTAWPAPGRTPSCSLSKGLLDIESLLFPVKVRRRTSTFSSLSHVSGLFRPGRTREPEAGALFGYLSRWDLL